jgi:hypothetical protein
VAGNDLKSEPLGERTATGPAALLASSSPHADGFFAAYPSSDVIEVLFIPRRRGREIDTSDVVRASVDAKDARDLALAMDGDSGPTGLALAYRTDVPPALVLVSLDVSGDAAPKEVTVRESRSLRLEGQIEAGPTLGYAPTGFVDPGSDKPSGGWLVSWVERDPSGKDHLIAARVAEYGTEILNERISLVSGAVREPFAYLKHAGGSEGAPHVGYLIDEVFQTRAVSCDIDN